MKQIKHNSHYNNQYPNNNYNNQNQNNQNNQEESMTDTISGCFGQLLATVAFCLFLYAVWTIMKQ